MANSKKLIGILIALVSAFALCAVLGACSGGSGANKATFPGKWVMTEVSMGGETITYEDADADMKKAMEDTYFDLKEDGTAEISDMGMTATTKREAKSDTEATITENDVTITMKLEGDKMIVTSDSADNIITMRKA